MTSAGELLEAIRAVAPATGLICGDAGNKATWIIQFDSSATQAQRNAAQAVVDGWDYDAKEAAERARIAAFAADAGYADLLAKLKTASVAEIDTWLANNVTSVATARAVLAAVIKFMVVSAFRLGE